MKSRLLEHLRSPDDGSPLELDAEECSGDEIITGSLRDAAGTRFPIREGVPLFAEELSDDETFGFKWTKIGASYGHEEPSRRRRQEWYLERFGYATRDALLDQLHGRDWILDAGTGSGVDAAVFAESGRTVVAADLSRHAALATYRSLGHLDNVNVIQADIHRLPFAEGHFDYISSDQVLHHTPDTETAFKSVARYLAPGGRILIYVYNRKGPIREFSDDFIRAALVGKPPEEAYEVCRQLTLLGKALSDLHVDVELPEAIPLLEIPAGTHDVQRLFYWNVLKCFWNDEYDFELNVMINFDWYHPKWAFRHTREEVEGWFDDLDLEIERAATVPSGISVVGSRRQAGAQK